MKITKWKTINSVVALKAFIFRYKQIERESPTTAQVGKFDVIECLNWVNVVAITPDQKIVLIKQYRHGIDDVTIEIPGGAVHPGEDFLLAAQRELQEETGYTSTNWKFLGRLDANPAFMTNYCETYLALDAIATHPQELDPFEEIDVYLRDKSELKEMVKNREITHSLIVAAFYLADA
jgi:ADP-ribose pyrophosphatase